MFFHTYTARLDRPLLQLMQGFTANAIVIIYNCFGFISRHLVLLVNDDDLPCVRTVVNVIIVNVSDDIIYAQCQLNVPCRLRSIVDCKNAAQLSGDLSGILVLHSILVLILCSCDDFFG